MYILGLIIITMQTSNKKKRKEKRKGASTLKLSSFVCSFYIYKQKRTQPNKTMGDRDPITCHALNTYTGTPAAGLNCVLTLIDVNTSSLSSSSSPSIQNQSSFTATTDADGRVKKWQPSPSSSGPDTTVSALIKSFPSPSLESENSKVRSVWSVKFLEVDKWYAERGVKDSFWPEVEVRFVVDGKEGEAGWRNYHVPVLLGPWNYSTYRGS